MFRNLRANIRTISQLPWWKVALIVAAQFSLVMLFGTAVYFLS